MLDMKELDLDFEINRLSLKEHEQSKASENLTMFKSSNI
jgi:hypothetical protein